MVEEFVWLDPPLLAVEVVEDVVVVLLDPSWPVLAVEPVEVVVPAVPPEPAPTWADPPDEVVVDAVPVSVDDGVGVEVPAGL